MSRATRDSFIRNLAAALLAGPWTPAGRRARARRACGPGNAWLRGLARRIQLTFGGPPTREDLERFLHADEGVARAVPEVREWFWLPAGMSPRGPASAWDVPPLCTVGQLADWLQVSPPRLHWLADPQERTPNQPVEALRHYRYTWLPKRRGGHRLLEDPKPTLKRVQRQVLHAILDRIPPHESAHGFRAGRSIATCVQPHVGKGIVLRFDLRDFFASIPASRVHAIFRVAGYPADVARLLTGLCGSRTPAAVLSNRLGAAGMTTDDRADQRLRSPHLPQGAPTSPALANLAAFRFDRRLAGLATKLDATYTRYADDLAFSGGERLARAARRLQVHVARIALEEGFDLHARKSRFMRQSVRQQLAGSCSTFGPTLFVATMMN
jgi:RNA-directed DNA polymerase